MGLWGRTLNGVRRAGRSSALLRQLKDATGTFANCRRCSPESAARIQQPFIAKPEHRRECVMDWNRVEGNWRQFKGHVKERWGRLTDDDLDVINGQQEQLEGKIQERYGLAKDQAKKDVEAWFDSLP
jgi:uncharacterized protein YjbJ (UPF0337 family)